MSGSVQSPFTGKKRLQWLRSDGHNPAIEKDFSVVIACKPGKSFADRLIHSLASPNGDRVPIVRDRTFQHALIEARKSLRRSDEKLLKAIKQTER